MWHSYFFQLQKKYNMRISTKSPFVIRFDGRQITKNESINLLDVYKGSFVDSLEKTAQYFSQKYHCFSIFGSDEISFVILEPNLLIEDLEPNDKTTYSQELLALFSQYFFDYFNHFDTHKKIFWHGKCFSIPEGKVASYIKYRSKIIENVMVTYFAKKNSINEKSNLLDKLEKCKGFIGYEDLIKIKDGVLYYDGEKIKLDEFLNNGNVEKIGYEEIQKKDIFPINIDDMEIEMF